MKNEGTPSRKRVFWLSSLGIALVVHLIGLLIFQLGEEEQAAEETDLGFLSLPSLHGQSDNGELLREQAYLRDSAPLFLPTPRNAATAPAVKALEERPAALFDSFPARLSFGERDFGLGSIVAADPVTPLETLAAFGNRTHTTFGQVSQEAPELEKRFALLEVFRPSGGPPIASKPLAVDDAPAAGEQLWRPAEFLIQVTAVGVMGEPVMLRGSGVEAVDQFLRASIRTLSRERLPEVGYYRVVVGP